MKRTIVRTDDGNRMAVIRPCTATLAREAVIMAEIAAKHNDNSLFQRIPAEVGDYTFMGYLARDNRNGRVSIVDKGGKHLADIQPGDSFVDESSLVVEAN